MSVYLIPEIWCDICRRREQPEHDIDIESMETWASDTRSHYEGEGWQRQDGKDVCPSCAAEREGDSDE